jgi:hypothetical protein
MNDRNDRVHARNSSIDFKGIAAAALASAKTLLHEWLPGGRLKGREYVALNPTRNDRTLGSFQINWQTGQWSDFAVPVKGGDLISLFAYINSLDQGQAARQIAERLGLSTYKSNGLNNHAKKSPPKIDAWGEEGPAVGHDELRRHYYPKNGGPKLKVKIKRRNVPKHKEWLTCYRVIRDGTPTGWQWQKPKDYRDRPYFGTVQNAKLMFWCEGEKDADTLDRVGLPVFTFGGTGDGLPKSAKDYLELLKDRLLVIVIDNDKSGSEHGHEKAKFAHAAGVARIRIFNPAAVWPDCKEKADISDWITEGGGTREKLLEIVETLLDWQPTPENTDEPTDIDDTSLSWECPDRSLLDDRRGELPPFPLDVLSPSWQEWATNAAHGAGTAVDHVVVPLLGIASSLIGIARRVRASRSWPEPFTMWTAIVGYSGTGKTPGLDVTQRALARVERNRKPLIGELRRAHESKIESAKATHKQWKEKVKEAIEAGRKGPEMPADAEIPESFVAPRLCVSDSTIERLAVLLQARPHGMLVIRDELAGLFLNLQRYSGGSDKEFWLEAWNGKPYKVERMNRPPVDVEHLLVGVTGGFQPDKLARSFDGDADGIYARVLFAWPAEAPYRPLTDTIEEVEPEFENALTKLIDLAEFEEGKLITRDARLTPDAVTVFEQHRQLVDQKKKGLDGREREWWVKTPAHVLRLAGTLAYLDWAREKAGTTMQAPNTIEARFAAAAARLMTEYFWPHARAALRQLGLTERHAKGRRVLRWLQAERSPGSEVSATDIRRDALGQSLDAKATTGLIEELVQAGWLRPAPIEKDGPGRPPLRWLINPLLWGAENAENAENSHCRRELTTAQPEGRVSAFSAFSASTLETNGDEDGGGSGEESTWTV